MASSKRRQNKKLYQRRRRRARSGAVARTTAASSDPAQEDEPMPSEMDQMGVFIAEPELGRPETDLTALRSMVRRLPFEPAISKVALLLCRLGPRLTDPPRQWELAKHFYASQPELLAGYERVLVSLDAMGLPGRDAIMAYELQAATFFRRPQYLEEMARHHEYLRLATDDPRLVNGQPRFGHRVARRLWDQRGTAVGARFRSFGSHACVR
jgi:hypothetical protein